MEVQKTALYNYHKNLGAKFVSFAGYEMPIQYKDGIVIAIGKEENFYKYTLPTFELKNNTLIYNSGLGPMELQKSTEKMPTIDYGKPVNND